MSQSRQFKVIHVEDDPFQVDRVSSVVVNNSYGFHTQFKSYLNVSDFLQFLTSSTKDEGPDLLILDIHIGGEYATGIDLLEKVRPIWKKTVIMMWSFMDDASTMSLCLKKGADDFLSKLTDKEKLHQRIFETYLLIKERQGNGPFGQEGSVSSTLPPKSSPPLYSGKTFEKIATRIPRIIQSAITNIHIHGDSGVGKELVADLFQNALGSSVPFVKVNCGSFNQNLIESELFGYEKGAFTGAAGDKKGLLEVASGGWVFLDEVATLASSTQVALLRAIENQEIIRVGSTKPKAIQIRILSATNENLSELIAQGKFRNDLWQRLNEGRIDIPSLRERSDEVEELVAFFLKTLPSGPYTISESALKILKAYSWKDGNVRELRNCLRAMTELHVNKHLTPISVPDRIFQKVAEIDIPESSVKSHPLPINTLHESAAKHLDIRMNFDPSSLETFDTLSLKLLCQVIEKLFQRYGRMSLRQLSKFLDLSRTSLSPKLKNLVEGGHVTFEELSRWVNIN